MATTRKTLLARVRDPADRDAWQQFYELYAPMIYRYARSLGLPRGDAEEVSSDCLEIVARRIPTLVSQAERTASSQLERSRVASSSAVTMPGTLPTALAP